jgi:hypothetical protein
VNILSTGYRALVSVGLLPAFLALILSSFSLDFFSSSKNFNSFCFLSSSIYFYLFSCFSLASVSFAEILAFDCLVLNESEVKAGFLGYTLPILTIEFSPDDLREKLLVPV